MKISYQGSQQTMNTRPLKLELDVGSECQVSLDEMTAIRRTRHKTNVWESTNPHFLSKEMTASDRVVNTRKRNSCEPKLCKEVFPTPFGEEGKSNEAKRRNKRGGCAMQCAMCT